MNHPGTYIAQLIVGIGNLVDMALPIAAGLAFLFFLWGLARFIFASGNEKALASGRNRMIQGVIALFVMVSVWGLTSLLRVLLGLDAYTPADPGIRDPIPARPQQVCEYNAAIGGNICYYK